MRKKSDEPIVAGIQGKAHRLLVLRLNGLRGDFLEDAGLEIGERQAILLMPIAIAHGDGGFVHLLLADDKHVGNLLPLGVAYLGVHPLVGKHGLGAYARALELGGDLLGVIHEALAHGDDGDPARA